MYWPAILTFDDCVSVCCSSLSSDSIRSDEDVLFVVTVVSRVCVDGFYGCAVVARAHFEYAECVWMWPL